MQLNNYQSFDDYLKEKHMEEYDGTDDDAPDAYEDWITNLQVDDLLMLGEKYGGECFLKGQSINK
jgi:capsule polysaccharide modification protein KpsS